MRALVNLVENLINSIRFIIGLIFLVIMGLGLMLSVGASYVAPKAAESFAESAERVGEKAVAAAQQERRAKEMAEDGWGYSAPAGGS